MKKLLVLFASVVMLAGCGNNEATTTGTAKTAADENGDYATAEITLKGDKVESISLDQTKEGKSKKLIKKIFTASCTKSLSHAAMNIRKINFSWGVMCGIRPAKNVRELFEEGYSGEEIAEIFKNV